MDSLHQEVIEYLDNGKYLEAAKIQKRICNIISEIKDEKNSYLAEALDFLASMYIYIGDISTAQIYSEKALKVFWSPTGKYGIDYVSLLETLANIYLLQENFADSERLYRQGLNICREIGANDPIKFSRISNALAQLYLKKGKYSEAEQLCLDARNSIQRTLGESYPYYTDLLYTLAEVFKEIKKYSEAEQIYQKILEIIRKTVGEEHTEVAVCLRHLSSLYEHNGYYSKSEKYFIQALEITGKTLGEQHPHFAMTLTRIAFLYFRMGYYSKAKNYAEMALEIAPKVLGEENITFSECLHIVGIVYEKIGDYSGAEEKIIRSLELSRKLHGNEHSGVAHILYSLAILYHRKDNDHKAEQFNTQALDIYRKVFGENHEFVANTINDLALSYRMMGNYNKAEKYFIQALEITGKTLGDQHPHFAMILFNLGVLYSCLGDHSKAINYLIQVLKVQYKRIGRNHPDFVQTLNEMAVLYAASDRNSEALSLLEKCAIIEDSLIDQIFSFGSERQRMLYLYKMKSNFYMFLSIVILHFKDSVNAKRKALNFLLHRKAILSEASIAQREALLGYKYPHLKDKLFEIAKLKKEISQKSFEYIETREPEPLNILKSLSSQKEKLESYLSNQIDEIQIERHISKSDLNTILREVPYGVAMVEFVHFHPLDFHTVNSLNQETWKPDRYLAFIFYSDRPEEIELIDLGEAKIIDNSIIEFIGSINEDENNQNHSKLIDNTPRKTTLEKGCFLRSIVFDPLIPLLKGYNNIFLAPDSELARLPFEVLPIGTDGNKYLIDNYRITYISTSRDILRFRKLDKNQYITPLIVVDPDFDLSSSNNNNVPSSTVTNTIDEISIQLSNLDSLNPNFHRLPNTRIEGEIISDMLNVFPWTEDNVLDYRIKMCKSPYILHIATHGYFLPSQDSLPSIEEINIAEMSIKRDGIVNLLSWKHLENPLLRSGLALAGANTRINGGILPLEAEDGILTAEDVTDMDLTNTELVTLSACNTALGDIHIGEGVYGLKRSFILAGAQTLVMSLWKVPDKETRELMVDFYRRLKKGKGRSESLREAQLEMKKKYPHPYYWGAFICQGNPGPLFL